MWPEAQRLGCNCATVEQRPQHKKAMGTEKKNVGIVQIVVIISRLVFCPFADATSRGMSSSGSRGSSWIRGCGADAYG